jgi:hypothetical protein
VKRLVLVLFASGAVQSYGWSQLPCPAWRVESDQAGAQMGSSVASAGDVNGDGYADVVVATWLYDEGEIDEGRVQAYLGSATGLSLVPGWTAASDQVEAYLGEAACAGDVNGDGYDDLIVGAKTYESDSTFQSGEGAAFLFLGSAAGLAIGPAWTVEGNQAFARLGSVAGAGDVNGDGYDDVIVGASLYSNGAGSGGAAFLYLGSATGLPSVPAWTAEGDDSNGQFGDVVAAAGDVNGDGYGDVIVGAPTFSDGQSGEGVAHVYLGSATGLAMLPAAVLQGDQSNAGFGASVSSAGDVDADGFDDVLVGAPKFVDGQTLEGHAFLYRGSAGGVESTPAWTAEKNQAFASLGISVAGAGDLDGDGYDDVLIGAERFDAGQLDEGGVFAYMGSATGLEAQPRWFAQGEQVSSRFGHSVAGAGDVNQDGFDDALVGAPLYDRGETSEGSAFAYLGSPFGLSRSAVFAGDGIDVDAIAPLDVVVGSSWSAPITIGHAHGTGGPLALRIRSSTVNGPNFTSPIGGRLTETLIAGPFLAAVTGTHDGLAGDVPAQPIPNDPTLVGTPWAAQYTVAGGGFVDLSRAVFGVISACP